MTQSYRLATIADTEEIFILMREAYAPIRELGISFPAAKADIEMVRENIQDNACYILEEDKEIIATITIRFPWSTWINKPMRLDIPYLCWFAVKPNRKNQRIGAQLLQWTEEVMIRDTLKASAVALASMNTHPWLIEMYERNGYKPFFEEDFGAAGKTIYMQKSLTSNNIEIANIQVTS